MFGFVANLRLKWKGRVRGFFAPLLVLIAAVKAARESAHFRKRKTWKDAPAEKIPGLPRRPMSVRFAAFMRKRAARRQAERFGYTADTLSPDGMPWIHPDDRRLMRNARKRERAAA